MTKLNNLYPKTTRMRNRFFLLTGGIGCMLISMLHIAIAVKGGAWYRFFGAGETIASLAENGSMVPAIITILLAIGFFLLGFYAFAAHMQLRLPLHRRVLLTAGIVFTLRGFIIVPLIMAKNHFFITRFDIFSLVALLIGILYLTGTLLNWHYIPTKNHKSI